MSDDKMAEIKSEATLVDIRRKCMQAVGKTVRPLVGLALIVMLVFAYSPVSMAAAHARPVHQGAVCQSVTGMQDATLERADCGQSGFQSPCSAHSTCVSFVMQTARFAFELKDTRRWNRPHCDDLAGLILPIDTPPPITAA